MKKIVMAFLCLLLIAALAMTAYAAGSASFSMAASGTTLRRGDTVTLTVSVSCDQPATSYGLQLSYDTSVFELVGGSTSVPGALINSFNNGFAFMFQTPTAYSGTVGTVTLKVKETAAFGSYAISGAASVRDSGTAVSASGCSKTVTVACSHSFGSWSDAGNGKHSRTCSVCAMAETVNHTWNGGAVTKEASCKEAGVKTYTCTACNSTKTESVAKTTDHKYGSWAKVNDTTHKHTCTVCSKEETASHIWNSGTVTKEASCKEAGVKTYTCTACNSTKTENIAKTTDHKYGSWAKVNDTTHKHTCTICSKEETASHTWNSGTVTKQASCKEAGVKTYTCTACNATKTEAIDKLTTHTYDHACDTDCNVCGATRTTNHTYKTSWSKDRNNHWHECSVCKDQKDAEAHTPGAEATETKAQTCTACGYVIKAALGHKHSYATAWTTDENGHWYACSGCEEKGSYAAHDFENACDPDCSVCGFTHETAHSFAEAWTTDTNNHWHVCSGCGLKENEAAHEPGAEATETAAQTCTICGCELAPALGNADGTAPTESTPATDPATDAATPADPTEPEDGSFPWWIILAVAVVAAGVVAVVVIKKKK